MKPMYLDGITYDAPFIRQLRDKMIELRDEAIKQADFEYGVIISHVIALLNKIIVELE